MNSLYFIAILPDQELQKEVTEQQFDIEGMEMANNLMDPRTKKYLKDEIESKKDRLTTLKDKLKEETEKFLHSQVIVAGEPNQANLGEPTYATEGSSIATITSLRQSILNTKLRIGQDSTLLQNYDMKLADLHAEAVTLPEKIIQTSSLKRSQAVAEKMYGQLEDRYLEAWMTEESAFGNVRAEDPAGLNAAPIRPNRQSSIFTGSLLGLAIGIGIVVLLVFGQDYSHAGASGVAQYPASGDYTRHQSPSAAARDPARSGRWFAEVCAAPCVSPRSTVFSGRGLP